MIDSYTSANHHDFNARYAQTYGWLLQPDKVEGKLFVHLREADGDAMYFDTGTQMTYSSRINSGVEFQFIPVNRGWFSSTSGEVYFLQRVPERQWKRGISQNNTRITNIDGMYSEKIGYNLLASIFNLKETITYQAGKPFCISKHFAISQKGIVYFYTTRVGAIKDNIITIGTEHNVLQELNDAINRNKLPFKVKAE